MSPGNVALPPGWASVALGDLLSVKYGKGLPARDRVAGEVPVYSAAGHTGQHNTALTNTPVLVIARKGVGVGDVFYAPEPCWVIDTALYAEVPSELNSQFLLYAMRAARLSSLDKSSAIPGLNRTDLARVPIGIPSRPEQDRIIEMIEHFSIEIDNGHALFERALDGAERFKQALLGELYSSGYPLQRVGHIGTVFLGFTPSRRDADKWNGDVPWVSSGEVAFCRISETRESISESSLGNRERRVNPPGTVLLAMYGEGKTRGQVAILDIEAATNQAVAAVRLNPRLMIPEFLYYCLEHQYAAVRAMAQGGQQKNLNGELVRAIEVPCPPIGAQRALVAELDRRLDEADGLASTLRLGLSNGDDLRRSLLHHALTGRIAAEKHGSLGRAVADGLCVGGNGTGSSRKPRPVPVGE